MRHNQTKLTNRFLGYSLAGIIAVGLVPSVAYAQQATPTAPQEGADAASDAGGEIVVTAQKKSERIDKVPLSIQAFSSETLRRAGVSDTAGITQLTPGLSFARSSANTPIFTLRGIGFNTPNLSSTSPVGVYYDEVAYAYPFMANGPVFDIERVEVLKGPQGTLYGRNTTGGLINFIPSRAVDRAEGSVTVEGGNYATLNTEGFINEPITSTLSTRLAWRTENSSEGWQHSISRPGDTLGKKNRFAIRSTTVWTPTPQLNIILTGSYWRDRSDTIAPQAIVFRPEQPAFVNPGLAGAVRSNWANNEADWAPSNLTGGRRPESNDEFYSIAGRITYSPSDTLKIISLTAYNHVKRDDYNNASGTQYPIFDYQSIGSVGSFSQELRLQADFGKASLIVGGYYSHDKIVDNQVGIYNSSTGAFLTFLAQNVFDPAHTKYTAAQYADGFNIFGNRLNATDRSASVFGNADYQVTDKLKLSIGARYTSDRLEYGACSTDFNNHFAPVWSTSVYAIAQSISGNAPSAPVQTNGCLTFANDFKTIAPYNKAPLTEHNVSGRISGQYQFDPDNMAYFSVSRGYKSGAAPVLPAFVESQYNPARQEHVTAYEIGTKSALFGRKLHVSLAAFYDDYANKQLFSEVPDPVFTALKRIVNVPKSRIYGFEGDVAVRATPELQLNLGAAYTNTKILTFNGFNTLGQAVNFAGSPFPYTPKWQVTGGFVFDRPISSRLGFSLSTNASYQSSTSTALGNETGLYLKAYTVVSGTIGIYQLDKRWRFELWAKNLLNENYWTTADVQTDTAYRLPGAPRTFGARVNVNF